MELTKAQRLILLNQYRMLELLDPDQAHACDEARQILENGYALSYEELVTHIVDDMSVDACREVRDVLGMYRALKNALRDLPPGTLTASDAAFQGFDGNDETDCFSYATFLIETQGKWAESKGDTMNAHQPMLARYRRMLASWKESARKLELTVDDVRRILGSDD